MAPLEVVLPDAIQGALLNVLQGVLPDALQNSLVDKKGSVSDSESDIAAYRSDSESDNTKVYGPDREPDATGDSRELGEREVGRSD